MKNSAISWTDHTFNGWIGCAKVSPGCERCYAETRDIRFGGGLHWGHGAPRLRTGVHNWNEPLRWARDAAAGKFVEISHDGVRFARGDLNAIIRNKKVSVSKTDQVVPVRPRVFSASLSDWLDDEVDVLWLVDLLRLIRRTPELDWLMLTKRPENWKKRLVAAKLLIQEARQNDFEAEALWILDWIMGYRIPKNVWIGTTVEDQARAFKRIPQLCEISAHVHFLSCEPLLEAVVLPAAKKKIDWIICGGESGKGARPMDLAWAASLLTQARDRGAAYFMKQLGGESDKRHRLEDFPEPLRIQEFPK